MSRSVEEILASSRDILGNFKKTPKTTDSVEFFQHKYDLHLNWAHKVYCVLAPVGFEWSDTIQNLYPGDSHKLVVSGHPITHIIHGHNRNLVCFAKYQCHVLGYKPDGTEGENFGKRWKRFGYAESTTESG